MLNFKCASVCTLFNLKPPPQHAHWHQESDHQVRQRTELLFVKCSTCPRSFHLFPTRCEISRKRWTWLRPTFQKFSQNSAKRQKSMVQLELKKLLTTKRAMDGPTGLFWRSRGHSPLSTASVAVCCKSDLKDLWPNVSRRTSKAFSVISPLISVVLGARTIIWLFTFLMWCHAVQQSIQAARGCLCCKNGR